VAESSEFDSLLKKGQDLKRRGELDQAERFFSSILKKHSYWIEGRLWRASIRIQRKQYGQAREDLDSLADRLSKPGWHNLLRAEVRIELGNYMGALEDLDHAKIWGEQAATTLGLRGVALTLADRWTEAYPILDEALRIEPGPKMLLRMWGHFASNSEETLCRIARDVLKTAEENPKKLWLTLLGGSALLYADYPEKAIPPLKRAARAMPTFFYAQLNYGAALMQGGDAEEAERVLDKAIELDQSQPRPRALRGEARIRRGNDKGAREDFIAALAIDHAGILPGQWEDGPAFSEFMTKEMPDNADAQMNRGAYLINHTFRPWNAIGYLETAIELEPRKARAWALLGEAKFYCFRWYGALKAFSAAVSEDRDGKVRLQWSDGPAFWLYCSITGN